MKKLKEEKIINPIQNSFKVIQYKVTEFDMAFHFHQEYELVYIIKGNGIRYIGNSEEQFKPGDMIFVGPNLGHMWKSDKNDENEAEAIVIQFSGDLLSSLIHTPEFLKIKQLLEQSNSGLKIYGSLKRTILQKMQILLKCNSAKSFIGLLEILDELSISSEVTGFNLDKPTLYMSDNRINAVYQYTQAYFQHNISLDDAASIANMEKSAFCRFFKEKTQKTYIQFLNEIRINKACELLQKNETSITEIAYDCGFNNIANFYRQFKKYMGMSPGRYLK